MFVHICIIITSDFYIFNVYCRFIFVYLMLNNLIGKEGPCRKDFPNSVKFTRVGGVEREFGRHRKKFLILPLLFPFYLFIFFIYIFFFNLLFLMWGIIHLYFFLLSSTEYGAPFVQHRCGVSFNSHAIF